MLAISEGRPANRWHPLQNMDFVDQARDPPNGYLIIVPHNMTAEVAIFFLQMDIPELRDHRPVRVNVPKPQTPK